MRHHLILLIVVLGSILCFGRSYGQVSSAAFDPNCYFPRIGVAGEIDTIYGSQHLQFLGSNLLNIGPSPGDSYGRISCNFGTDAYPHHEPDSIFTTGHDFDLHKLNITGSLNVNNILRRGHFRSPRYSDLLYFGGGSPSRIYWQDDQGNYDSSRYTILSSPLRGKLTTSYYVMASIYSSNISSDSTEDIIYSSLVVNSNTTNDSIFLLYFKGGESLYKQGKNAIADSIIFFDTLLTPETDFGLYQGDFRGVQKTDLLMSDRSNNIFYFKNIPPFSMKNLATSLKEDTIYAQWQDSKSKFTQRTLTMKALSKFSGDASEDFLAFFNTDYPSRPKQIVQEIRIFKGGKDFGSHRWTADSAAFTIHEPYYYDLNYHDMGFGGYGVYDCGDLTGTGNPVLYVSGNLDGYFYGYHFFYVLGKSIDDKIDMEIGPIPNNGVITNIDTLVADKDNLDDVILALAGYNGDDDPDPQIGREGTIYIIHGSNKIPVKTNSIISRKSVDESPSHILAYPNPCSQSTVLTFDNCLGQKMMVYVVSTSGQTCLHQETPGVDGLQQYAVDLSTLSAGEYIVNLSCPTPGWSSSVKVVKTGSAQTPWSFDLKKMVGR